MLELGALVIFFFFAYEARPEVLYPEQQAFIVTGSRSRTPSTYTLAVLISE